MGDQDVGGVGQADTPSVAFDQRGRSLSLECAYLLRNCRMCVSEVAGGATDASRGRDLLEYSEATDVEHVRQANASGVGMSLVLPRRVPDDERMATDLATRAVHSAVAPVPDNQPAVAPLYGSSGWKFASLDQLDAVQRGDVPGCSYGTLGGPNHDALERLVAALEGSEAAVCANGGMTAIASCLRHLLRPGDCIVAARDLFGPTLGLLTVDLPDWGVECDFADATDLDSVELALSERDVSVLYAETISNPCLRVVDVAALADAAHRHGALLVVDNTFASPALCRPLRFGADVVIESLTKYVGGHYDCVVGAIAGRASVVEPMQPAMLRAGLLPSPLEAWLCVRGAQTFPLRISRCSETAATIAAWLEDRVEVEGVLYPGLRSHPDHAAAGRMLSLGFGGVLSFELSGRPAVERFVGELGLVELVSSLGGVATTVNHPASTSHRNLREDERAAIGIHDGLLRLAVGIESVDDILHDLDSALTAARETLTRPVVVPSAAK